MPAARAITSLIVDDQQTIRSLVRNGLRQLGFCEIYDAVDGEDGLRSLTERPVHLVISDFNMPNLDGLGLLKAIRSHPKPPVAKSAFILLTGRADKDLVQRAVQFGASNFLVKPFTVMTLKQKIESVFGELT